MKPLKKIVLYLILCIVAISVIYVATKKPTLIDILVPTLIGFTLYKVFLFRVFKYEEDIYGINSGLGVIVMPMLGNIIGLICGFITYSVLVSLVDALVFLNNLKNPIVKILLSAFGSLIIAYFLYVFKKYQREIYGFCEIPTGVILAVTQARILSNIEVDDVKFYFAVFSVSIVLIAKGFENLYSKRK